MSTPPNSNYNPNSIQHLTAIEHVRKRPGMYIGGTDERALHHLIYETMNHAVEEALHGFCDHIWLTLRDDNKVTIRDNGPGLPMDYMESRDLNAMEVIMEQLGGIDRGQNGAYKITVGMMGVGLSTVNALSAEMRVENARDGFLWQKTYRQGIPTSPLKRVSPIPETGTAFTFKPDYTILQPNSFDYDHLAHRCRELAYQIVGLHITIRDERVTPPREQTFYSADGLKTLIAELNAATTPFHTIVHVVQDVAIPLPDDKYETFGVEFAFQFTDGPQSHLLSYVNTVETTAGGTHLSALKASILSVLNDFDSHIRPNEVAPEAELTWRDISTGLSVVISIRHPEPHFMSPTRALLGNQEVYGPVAGLVFNAFYQHLNGMDFHAREKLMTHLFAKHIAPSADTDE